MRPRTSYSSARTDKAYLPSTWRRPHNTSSMWQEPYSGDGWWKRAVGGGDEGGKGGKMGVVDWTGNMPGPSALTLMRDGSNPVSNNPSSDLTRESATYTMPQSNARDKSVCTRSSVMPWHLCTLRAQASARGTWWRLATVLPLLSSTVQD